MVTLWDTETRQSLMDLDGHDRRIWSVDYCSCGWGDMTTFASGSDDCTVKVRVCFASCGWSVLFGK